MTNSVRTLIVEDDPMVTSIYLRYLQRLPEFQVMGTAPTGEQAWAMIGKDRPNLILLDVYMPSGGGMEVLQRLRAANYAVDVILITAADNPETIEHAMRLGAVDYILKPFDFERFRGALQRYLRRRAVLRSTGPLVQSDLDTVLGKVSEPLDDANPPKGIDAITLRSITDVLYEAPEPLSAQDIAAQLQLSRITTRKYLEYLCQFGFAELELKYAEKGRPTKLYRLLERPAPEDGAKFG